MLNIQHSNGAPLVGAAFGCWMLKVKCFQPSYLSMRPLFLFSWLFAYLPMASAAPLALKVAREIDSRIAGADPLTSKPIFSVRDDYGAIYVRNPLCWAAGLDLTPLSVWNSLGGHERAGILISPRHIVSAAHFPVPPGTTIRWVTRTNVTVERQVIAQRQVAGTDIMVGLLDTEVPATITVARILPADYPGKLPLAGLPLLCSDKEKKALVANVRTTGGGAIYIEAPAQAARAAFFEDWIGGDSGSPGLIFVRSKPVLLLAAENPTNGPDCSARQAGIAAAMAQLGGGFQLTPAVLTAPPPRQFSGAVVIEPQ
jgi:hypothetical protein